MTEGDMQNGLSMLLILFYEKRKSWKIAYSKTMKTSDAKKEMVVKH